MTEKPTNELNEILEQTDVNGFEEYYKNNKEHMKDSDRSFYEYFKGVICEKKIKLKNVYLHACVSETYGGKIIRMEDKHTANRDLIIKLCMGGHFTWMETNRVLKLYGFSELYAKVPRDALIMIAINKRKYDIDELNGHLEQNGFEPFAMSGQEE